jgi:AraC family ethanolamine operon transcriptional activator
VERTWSTQDDAGLRIRSEHFESIENLKNPIGSSQIEIVQLGRGRFSGEILHGQIDDIAFSRGRFSLPMRATGVFSSDKLVIGMLLSCTGASRSLSEPVVPGDVLVHPAGSEHERLYEGAANFAGLMCDPAVLPHVFAAEDEASNPEFWAKRRHFRFAGPRKASLAALLDLLAGRLQQGSIRTGTAAEYWKRTVLDAFVGQVALEPAAGSEKAVPSSIRIVREVERYLDDNRDRPVHVSEICENIKVRRRTLYRAFDEAVGISPIEFLRAKRLSMVHLRLRQACPEKTGVVEIATELGFLELGRFAQQYRALFGEYPRETLRRNGHRKRSDRKNPSPQTIWHDSHNAVAESPSNLSARYLSK